MTASEAGRTPLPSGGRFASAQPLHTWPRWVYRTLIVIATVLLVVANVAVWVNLSFVDTSRFVDTTVGLLQQESMRHAIAQKSVDALLADRPDVPTVAANAAVNGVTTLLDTAALQDALHTVASQLQPMVVTGERPTITIESRAAQALALALGAALPPNTAPAVERSDGVVTIELFSRRDIPSFEPYVRAIQWAGLLSIGIASVLLVLVVWGSPDWPLGLRRVALALMSAAVVSAVIIIAVPLVLPDRIPDASAQTIVVGVYRAFASQFLVQGVILFVAGAVAWFVGWRHRTLRAIPAV